MKDKNGFDITWKVPRGTQIVRIPPHIAKNDVTKLLKDKREWGPGICEPGFITSGPTDDGDYFCRYWSYARRDWKPTGGYVPELRTKGNSERTSADCLYILDTFDQGWITQALENIEKGDK